MLEYYVAFHPYQKSDLPFLLDAETSSARQLRNDNFLSILFA